MWVYLVKVAFVVMAGAQVAVGSGFLDLVVKVLREPQVLHVAVHGTVEVSHGQVDGTHVPDLPRLLQLVAHLLDQLHALLVGGQGVGVVTDGCIYMACKQKHRCSWLIQIVHID